MCVCEYPKTRQKLLPVVSIPIGLPGGRSLRPVKNRGKVNADQNFHSIFTGQTTPLTKIPLYFTPPIFQYTPLKNFLSKGVRSPK